MRDTTYPPSPPINMKRWIGQGEILFNFHRLRQSSIVVGHWDTVIYCRDSHFLLLALYEGAGNRYTFPGPKQFQCFSANQIWEGRLAERCVLHFECGSLRTDLDAEHVFHEPWRTFSNLPLSLFSVRTPCFSVCGVPSPPLSTSYFLAFFSVLELQTGELRSVACSFQFVLPTLLLDECNIWALSNFRFTVCDFSWGIDVLWLLEIRSVGSIIYDFSDVFVESF